MIRLDLRQRLVGAAVAIAASSVLSVTAASAQSRPGASQPPLPVPDTASEPQGFVAEPLVVTRATLFFDRHLGPEGRSSGLFVDFGNMIPGAGWISAGPGYRQWFAGEKVMAEGAAAMSWNRYKTLRARIEMPRAVRSRVGLGGLWQWNDFGQVDYFGEGPSSSPLAASVYGLRSTQATAYGVLRPLRWLAIGAEAGVLQLTTGPAEGFVSLVPPDERTFIPATLSVTVDTRDFPDHPTQGAVLRAAASHYDDRDSGAFTFRRYEGELAGFVPIAGGRVVVASHGWLVNTDTEEGRSVPYYLLPALGGSASLRSFRDYRFHDRNLVLANFEVRVAMMTHVDAAFFVDTGNVAARLADLDLAKRSYGVGFRAHTRRATFARVDVARGAEGWSVVFSMNDALKLRRLSRQGASAPFVP